MKLHDVTSAAYREMGMSEEEIRGAEDHTRRQSVVLFGRDVSQMEVEPEEKESLITFLLSMVATPAKFSEARRRAKKFEEENCVDGVRN